jgi:small-conductance mechanosensitive channel
MNSMPFGMASPSRFFEESENWLARLVGNWVRTDVFPGVSWMELLMSLAVLVILTLLVQMLASLLKRVLRRPAVGGIGTNADHTHRLWLRLALGAGVAPGMLALWCVCAAALCEAIFVSSQPNPSDSALVPLLGSFRRIGFLVAFFWFLFNVVNAIERRVKERAATAHQWDKILAFLVVRALHLATPLIGLVLVIPTFDIPAGFEQFFKQTTSLLLIAAVGFIVFQMVQAAEEAVLGQCNIGVKDNLEIRKILTQVKVLKRIAVVLVVLFTVASMLMVFDSVRHLGASMLASAGVMGIVIGFAAQRSIATMVAGVQIAFTQPIRIDDVVIVESEWGQIEEITLTYVVVRTWDLRRLIVPISYFIEKPFQNWTRVSADLIGTVFLYADYSTPIQPLRDELDRILEKSNLWDHKVKVLQVTDTKDRMLELRALVSAANAGAAWDLRCDVRERLVTFLQREYPECLPKSRTDILSVPHINGAHNPIPIRSEMFSG